VLPAQGVVGTITEFSTGITAASSPYVIVAGPDNNLWFTEFSGNAIGRITSLPVAAPTRQSATSRKVHGSAGNFNLFLVP
jgi:streptogramin lyase